MSMVPGGPLRSWCALLGRLRLGEPRLANLMQASAGEFRILGQGNDSHLSVSVRRTCKTVSSRLACAAWKLIHLGLSEDACRRPHMAQASVRFSPILVSGSADRRYGLISSRRPPPDPMDTSPSGIVGANRLDTVRAVLFLHSTDQPWEIDKTFQESLESGAARERAKARGTSAQLGHGWVRPTSRGSPSLTFPRSKDSLQATNPVKSSIVPGGSTSRQRKTTGSMPSRQVILTRIVCG